MVASNGMEKRTCMRSKKIGEEFGEKHRTTSPARSLALDARDGRALWMAGQEERPEEGSCEGSGEASWLRGCVAQGRYREENGRRRGRETVFDHSSSSDGNKGQRRHFGWARIDRGQIIKNLSK
jgi:hypothetical protein